MTVGPPVVVAYDAAWPDVAARLIEELRAIAEPHWRVDHIGSTSVVGLAAKDIIDLQLRVDVLPDADRWSARLASLGYRIEHGARPDSPGVHHDSAMGDTTVPAEALRKQLFVRHEPPVILHVRRTDSPFAAHTVRFRDWLRAHPDERDRYAGLKRRLAAEHRDDADYDDYTRAKSAYFREVLPRFTAWTQR